MIYSFAFSPNGWTDGELAMKRFEADFDRQTKVKSAGEPHAMFMDGHSSHYTPEPLCYAVHNNITVLAYPPHCTHALQGLDVACFSVMKEHWNAKITAFEQENAHGLNKANFGRVFGKAFLAAFTQKTVLAAFEATGIHPYNPNITTEAQLKLSLPTSIQASFPVLQPSLICHLIQAFQKEVPVQGTPPPRCVQFSSPFTASPFISSYCHNRNIDPALLITPKQSQPFAEYAEGGVKPQQNRSVICMIDWQQMNQDQS